MATTRGTRTFAESAQYRMARLTDAVPAGAIRRLGRRAEPVDGDTLDPHLAMVLALNDRLHPEREGLSVQERREGIRTGARVAAGPTIPVGPVRDLVVDGAAGTLRARHYAPPTSPAGKPLLVFLHGGGWVVGDIETHDQPCRLLCRYADVHVLSVDYRLAPEHPYPAAADDAVAAFAWAAANAEGLEADPGRVAVGGDSAGGNLAAVVAQATRDAGTAQPAVQLLLYPGTDASRPYRSKDLFAEGYYLSKKQMDWYWEAYAAGASRTDPRLSPMCADDLAGLAPALVTTAAFDPLRDEGEAYAGALRAAGVPVVLRRAPGLVHAYLSMSGIHRPSMAESLAVAGALGAMLAR